MEQAFEFFEGTTTESSTTPRITLRRSGQLILTRAAVDMLGEDVEFVQLGFDTETRAVGIRSAPKSNRGRYLLRCLKTSPSRLVDSKRFFAHHAVTLNEARRFEVEDFGQGIVGFYLAETENIETNGAKKDQKQAISPTRKARGKS